MPVAHLAARAREAVRAFGEAFTLTADALRALPRRPGERPEALRQFDDLIIDSLPLTATVGAFTGMVLALQTAYALGRFGAKLYIGDMVSISVTRELGPVLTGVVAGARIAAGITATIGTMTVTEQVDAIRALGASVAKKLVLPRLLAVVIGLPLLTVFALALGMAGGFAISVYEFRMSPQFTFTHIFLNLHYRDLLEGLVKPFAFAFALVMIAVSQGLRVKGGAGGVGFAVMRAVVQLCIAVLVIDFFLTKLMFILLT